MRGALRNRASPALSSQMKLVSQEILHSTRIPARKRKSPDRVQTYSYTSSHPQLAEENTTTTGQLVAHASDGSKKSRLRVAAGVQPKCTVTLLQSHLDTHVLIHYLERRGYGRRPSSLQHAFSVTQTERQTPAHSVHALAKRQLCAWHWPSDTSLQAADKP